jgi:hypothetical protein
LQLGSADSRLLCHVRFELLSWKGVSAFADCFADFDLTELIWDGVIARASLPLPRVDSLIVSDFPLPFNDSAGSDSCFRGAEASTGSARGTFTGDATATRTH